MERGELQAVVDAAVAAYGLNVNPAAWYRPWLRYLGDLGFDETMAALDRHVLSGAVFPPKVGELRRAVIDRRDGRRGLPDADGAWRLAEHRLEAAASGIQVDGTGNEELDRLVSTVMREARVTGAFDRTTFLDHWRQLLATDDERRYGLPADAASLVRA